MKLYLYPKCSTCKDAVKLLRDNEIDVDMVDISNTPPTKAELLEMLKHQANQLKKLFNTSGLQYKDLQLKDKLPNMSLDQAITMLSKNGMLVKRPFLISKKIGLVGFNEEMWKEELGI